VVIFKTITVVDFEKQKEFIQSFQDLMKKIRKDNGCMSCYLVRDIEDENIFLLIEEWETQEDLFRHFRSDYFGTLSGALHLLSKKTEMKIHTVSSTQGIETVTKVRNKTYG